MNDRVEVLTEQKPQSVEQRSEVLAARFTEIEATRVADAATVAGVKTGSWIHDIVIAALKAPVAARNTPQEDPLFTEIIAIRMLLTAALLAAADGRVLCPEGLHAVAGAISARKQAAARRVRSQHAVGTQ